MRLKLCTHIASEQGLASVTTLIVGTKAAVLINPPLLLQDAQAVTSFVRSKTSNPLTAIFVSHHHPDHYFAANLLLEAFPTATLYAAPYVVAAIEKEYDEQISFWTNMVGSSVAARPQKPIPYDFSFFVLPDDLTSPILLIGPVQGSSPNHTLFWLPTERTIITGDVVFARNVHVRLEDVSNSVSLAAWRLSLDLIYSLDPLTIVTGHVEKGTQFDARKDMEHMYRYLDLFEDKVLRPAEEGKQKLEEQDLFRIFQSAFPICGKNLDFFLGRLAERLEAGQQSLGNGHNSDTIPSKKDLEGFVMAVDT